MSRRNVTAAMVLLLLISATTGFAADRYQWFSFGSDEECQIYVSPIIKRKYIAAQTSCVIPARMEVIGMIVRESLVPVLIGIAIGIAGALAAVRLVASLLFGVAPRDPLSFVLAAAAMLAVALLAAAVPARRASRVEPLVALRYE